MSILEGIKASSSKFASNKFIIKSKPNIKQTRPLDSENQLVSATNKQIEQFFTYMIQRSKHFQETLAANAILNEQDFCQKHLYSSVCIKTILKSVLDKMFTEKRLGKNLKGMNKSNLTEIQNAIWPSLERQIAIYQNERRYIQERDNLRNQIKERKKQILKELQNISPTYGSLDEKLTESEMDSRQNLSQKQVFKGSLDNVQSGSDQERTKKDRIPKSLNSAVSIEQNIQIEDF